MRPHGHAMNVLVDGDHAGLKAARRAGWISWSTG
ncbi:hypothetical protein HNR40_004274 [Nonomuraea endophytica]|uniref:Uncharacterized protein n=1 Tax=Nonomuraea endophytica TaxID=714136 RepID=A0A7W8EGS5_9ACTN|nr:hypothetical protein [Nonomuraea endophytica]